MLRSAASAERLFVAVAATAHEPGLEVEHLSPGRVVVVVVEVLDDFEGPPALEHIPADDIAPQRRCVLAVPAGGEADGRQVDGARLALQHNIGLGGACVVSVYRPPA